MNYQKFELHLSHIEKALSNVRSHKYTDKRKNDHLKSIEILFNKIYYEAETTVLPNDKLSVYKIILDYIYTCIQYLDSSILTLTPYEIIFCLEIALKDWLTDFENHIIVTSTTNDFNWYFQGENNNYNNDRKNFIENEFGVELKYSLIQILLPKYLIHDYLSNVLLFHELGHFVDNKLSIIEKLFSAEPQLANLPEPAKTQTIIHYKEYFADVFAAQYIGQSASHYLNYIAFEADECFTHPSTNSRILLVEAFENGDKNNEILNYLQKAVESSTKNKLVKRYLPVTVNDFNYLVPQELKNDSELFGLFSSSWNLWLDPDNLHKKLFSSPNKRCKVLNNLIEKSISNYMIMKKWDKNVLA